jgi:hypothetical protein
MGFPEKVSAVTSEASVKGVTCLSCDKWLMLRNHIEKNNASGKQVNRVAFVGLI